MSTGRKSSKERLINHNFFVYERTYRQEALASEIRNKERAKSYQPNDIGLLKEGEKHFNLGLSLDDAPKQLRDNKNFINGYNRAKRIEARKLEAYDLGFQHFIMGGTLNEASLVLKNNIYFHLGYCDARDQSLIDGICWHEISSNLEYINFKKKIKTRK